MADSGVWVRSGLICLYGSSAHACALHYGCQCAPLCDHSALPRSVWVLLLSTALSRFRSRRQNPSFLAPVANARRISSNSKLMMTWAMVFSFRFWCFVLTQTYRRCSHGSTFFHGILHHYMDSTLPIRPLKNPGNIALTWLPKLLNRIRVLPQNLALGMRTHTSNTDKSNISEFLVAHPH